MEFLNPWALWSGLFLGIPIWLHLRDRSRPRTQDFPSLMLLSKGFPGAMQRQKIRNWLQLLIRLLIIICLVLAWSKPRLKTEAENWNHFHRILALTHNGVYGQMKFDPEKNGLAYQREAFATLSKVYGVPIQEVPLLPELSGTSTEMRFGNLVEACQRIIAQINQSEKTLVVIPVFDEQALQATLPLLDAAQTRYTELHFLFWNLSEKLPQKSSLHSSIQADSNSESWKIHLTAHGKKVNPSLQLDLDGSPWQQLTLSNDTVTFELPKRQDGWRKLKAKPENQSQIDTTSSTRYWVWREHSPKRWIHFGSGLFTYPSLGHDALGRTPTWIAQENELSEAWQQPRAGLGALIIAGQPVSSETLEKTAAWVLSGGRLILTVGLRSDLAALNSRLLGPLKVGQLLDKKILATAIALESKPDARMQMGLTAQVLGNLGVVNQYFEFKADSSSPVLLTAANQPILIGAKPGKGTLLIWTTDLDSLNWTDAGISPNVALTHQAFLRSTGGGPNWQMTACDSVWKIENEMNTKPKVFAPDGQVFTRIQKDGGYWKIGPFPKPGFYRIEMGDSFSLVAVNLENEKHLYGDSFPHEFTRETKRNRVEPDLAMTQQNAASPKILNALLPLAVLLLLLDSLLSVLLTVRVREKSLSRPSV